MIVFDVFIRKGKFYSHLITTNPDLEELHRFAEDIGLQRYRSEQDPGWFQYLPPHEDHPHYDITSNRIRQEAVRFGAIQVPEKELARLSRVAHEKRQALKSGNQNE